MWRNGYFLASDVWKASMQKAKKNAGESRRKPALIHIQSLIDLPNWFSNWFFLSWSVSGSRNTSYGDVAPPPGHNRKTLDSAVRTQPKILDPSFVIFPQNSFCKPKSITCENRLIDLRIDFLIDWFYLDQWSLVHVTRGELSRVIRAANQLQSVTRRILCCKSVPVCHNVAISIDWRREMGIMQMPYSQGKRLKWWHLGSQNWEMALSPVDWFVFGFQGTRHNVFLHCS